MTARADRAVVDGMELVGLVRDFGTDLIGEFLRARDRNDLEALCVALAAMVPDDQPISDLLAWCDPETAKREQARRVALLRAAQRPNRATVHGTHARFNSEKARGLDPCDLCKAGERIYQRERARRRRAAAVAQATTPTVQPSVLPHQQQEAS